MTRWTNILVPLVVGVAAGWLVAVPFWDGSKQGLLVGLSVIAAGVLVRLARGLPFTTADQYEVEEIRKLTRAVAQIIRSLRILITAVLAGMLGLVLVKPILDSVQSVQLLSKYSMYVEKTLSGALAFILTYVVLRMLQVVKGDQDLTELQSYFVVRAVERKHAKRFDEQIASNQSQIFKNPEGYGRTIQ